jgi:hypothetical protein
MLSFWKNTLVVVLLSLGVSAFASVEGASPDMAVLGQCYLKFMLHQQVASQAGAVAAEAPQADQDQIKQAAADWSASQTRAVRKVLTDQFGNDARAKFEQFVADYTTAEKAGDAQFLAQMGESFGISPAPADYASLRKSAIDSFLQPDVAEGSKWLGEVQTWIDVRKKTPDTPALSIWLTRDQPTVAAKPSKQKKPVAKKPDTLADAEADMGEFTAGEEEVANPLDNFDEMRKKRSERKLEEAQAGMEQVASERETAEQEYAAKKTAAAQAEAEAMKRHADKLAATEKDALEQRKNSWVNRLKSIVGATVSAATGAFTGGIGTRAGEEAANAIFKPD